LTSNFVGTGPSSYEKIIYRAAVSKCLRNTDLWQSTTLLSDTDTKLGTEILSNWQVGMIAYQTTAKLLTSNFVGTGPSSYEKRIYRTAVSQRLRNSNLRRIININQHHMIPFFAFVSSILLLPKILLPNNAQENWFKSNITIYITISLAATYFGVITIIWERAVWAC